LGATISAFAICCPSGVDSRRASMTSAKWQWGAGSLSVCGVPVHATHASSTEDSLKYGQAVSATVKPSSFPLDRGEQTSDLLKTSPHAQAFYRALLAREISADRADEQARHRCRADYPAGGTVSSSSRSADNLSKPGIQRSVQRSAVQARGEISSRSEPMMGRGWSSSGGPCR